MRVRGAPDTRGAQRVSSWSLASSLCHSIIRDLEKLDGVQRGAASTIKGLGGIKGLIYEER